MRLIDRVEIKFYRSLHDVTIINLRDLNIISGKNDSGKSNILRALELFFDPNLCRFETDFSKKRLTAIKSSIKGKQFISVTVTLCTPSSYSTLPKKIKLTRGWDREGILVADKDNLESIHKAGGLPGSLRHAQSSLTRLFNSIRFIRVPAIRDERFYKELIFDLQQALLEREKRKRSQGDSDNLLRVASGLNEEVGKITEELNANFERVAGIASSLRLPANFSEIFQRLIIETKLGEHDLPLQNRGDGIQMRYIPTILNFITENSSGYFIWAFDEPENSCEYGMANELAQDFSATYSRNAQIFISSHSFNFLSLRGGNISVYRARLRSPGDTELLDISSRQNRDDLKADLGFLRFSEEMNRAYQDWKEKSQHYDELARELKDQKKPALLFEGKTDASHFSLAYDNLVESVLESDFLVRQSSSADNGSYGEGADGLRRFLVNHVWRAINGAPLICIFDADKEGLDQLRSLNKQGRYEDVKISGVDSVVYRSKDYPEVFAVPLVAPEFRSNFVDLQQPMHCFLCTELLYQNAEIPTANRKYPTKFDKTVYGFKGKKVGFLERIENHSGSVDFSGFEPTISAIDKIVDFYESEK